MVFMILVEQPDSKAICVPLRPVPILAVSGARTPTRQLPGTVTGPSP